MALVKDPVARARKVSTPLQARRLLDELEIELVLNDDLPVGWEAQAEAAIEVIDQAYSRDELDAINPETAGFPSTSPNASRSLGDTPVKPAAAAPAPSAKPAAAAPPAKPSRRSPTSRGTHPGGGRRRPSSAGGGRRRGRGRGARLPSTPSIPGVAEGRAIGAQIVGIVLGGSLLYLLLTDAEHPKSWGAAVPTAIKGVTTALSAIVGLGDPLRRAAKPVVITGLPAQGTLAHELATQVNAMGIPRHLSKPAAKTTAPRRPSGVPVLSNALVPHP
jgi:hypothetical protein